MKNKNFFQSVKRAAIGFVSGFRSERNFKVYTVIVLVFLCDSFCSKKDDDVKFIKDVAAGAVLAIGIAFFTAEGVILARNILC